jgi:hypothetical protein
MVLPGDGVNKLHWRCAVHKSSRESENWYYPTSSVLSKSNFVAGPAGQGCISSRREDKSGTYVWACCVQSMQIFAVERHISRLNVNGRIEGI